MHKQLLQVFIFLMILFISSSLLAQKRIVLKDYKGKFPIRRGIIGFRRVLELRRAITVVLEDQELLLPKGTLIEDERDLGKVVLPEGYSCKVKMGDYTITVSEWGVIRFLDDGIEELHVGNDPFIIAGQEVFFTNDGPSGLKFEDGKIWAGYLKGKTTWNHHGTVLQLDNFDSTRAYLSHEVMWNISFYPDGSLKDAFLDAPVELKTGAGKPVMAAARFVTFYPNGTLKTCFLHEDIPYELNGNTFLLPKGEEVFFEESGMLAQNSYIIVSRLKRKHSPEEIQKAKIYLDQANDIKLQAIRTDRPFVLKVDVKTSEFDYSNQFCFAGIGDSTADWKWTLSFLEDKVPLDGYLFGEQTITIANDTFVLKDSSNVVFHKNGIISNAELAKEKIVSCGGKRYKLFPGASLKFHDDGRFNYDMFKWSNEAKGLAVLLP